MLSKAAASPDPWGVLSMRWTGEMDGLGVREAVHTPTRSVFGEGHQQPLGQFSEERPPCRHEKQGPQRKGWGTDQQHSKEIQGSLRLSGDSIAHKFFTKQGLHLGWGLQFGVRCISYFFEHLACLLNVYI